MHSLPVFLRLTNQPVILLGSGEAADTKRRLLQRAGARVVGETEHARIAVVAIEQEAEANSAIVRLKARGVLVNAVDHPDRCDFTMPAIIDRDPVLIAIGTGGASAGLAKALRIALETLLPASLGKLAALLGESRQRIRARWPDPNDRRRAIDAAMAPGAMLDPLSDDAVSRVEQWLTQPSSQAAASFEEIPLRSPDPDDLTLRQARLLGRADMVFHVPGIPTAILDRARADAVRVASATIPEHTGSGLALWLRWSD